MTRRLPRGFRPLGHYNRRAGFRLTRGGPRTILRPAFAIDAGEPPAAIPAATPVASRAEDTPAPGLPRDEVDPPPRAPHRRDAARQDVGGVPAAGRVRPQRRTR